MNAVHVNYDAWFVTTSGDMCFCFDSCLWRYVNTDVFSIHKAVSHILGFNSNNLRPSGFPNNPISKSDIFICSVCNDYAYKKARLLPRPFAVELECRQEHKNIMETSAYKWSSITLTTDIINNQVFGCVDSDKTELLYMTGLYLFGEQHAGPKPTEFLND